MKKYTNHIGLLCVAAVLLTGCDYMHKVYLRGQVTDVSGQSLPGVVVRVAGTEFEALSTGVGQYSLGATTGILQLEFYKTGYAPAQLEVAVESLGRMDLPVVSLWPLPISEGVYFCENYRYFQTNHPRPNRYKVKDMGNALGTPVNPDLVIPWVDAGLAPKANPPCIIGHKVPVYDARMHRMQRVNAALIQTAGKGGIEATPDGEMQYPEEIWIAEKPVPMRSHVLDEPQKLLVELRTTYPLEPGVYAIHWGALDGYDSVDPRVFIFELRAPLGEGEGEGGDESAEDTNEAGEGEATQDIEEEPNEEDGVGEDESEG